MSQYFPEPFRNVGENINVKVNLSNYATKVNIKNISHVDYSSFALKTNLVSLKTEVDKLDIDNLVPVRVNLSKLSDVVKNDVVKKAVFDKLVENVNNIDANGFVLSTIYDTDKSELEKKIFGVTDLVKKTKLAELENKIPDVSGLATKSALTAVEFKIPNVSSLVKKTDFDKKTSEFEKKLTDHNHEINYLSPLQATKLTAENFAADLKQANLVIKTDFDDTVKSFNQKINSLKTKHLVVENELILSLGIFY